MFNVSKKTLSVVLCLALLLSVVAVCFMTPATAKTVVSQQYTYNYLPEVAPTVNLTFQGTEKYGIPLGRYTNDVAYENNYAKVKVSTNWIFFGKNGSVGQTTVKHNDTDTEKVSTALSNVYKLTKDNTYSITFKYKFLAGATVTSRTFTVGIATNPTTGPAKSDNTVWTNNSTSGLGVVWKVNGKTQTGTLTQDTDWQTVTVNFKAVVDGYFGMQCGGSVTGNQYFALDDVKIYECDTLDIDSTMQSKITFDNGMNGIGAVRYSSSASSYDKENGNRYGVINLKGTNVSAYLANTEYNKSTERITAATDLTNTERLAEIDEIYKNLFKFEQDKKYEISFKYRYPEDSTVTKGTELKFKVMADPLGQAHGADDLANWNASGKQCWVKDVYTSGTVLERNAGEWQDCKVIFTVKNSEEVAGYDNVRKNANGGYPFDGFYFGFLGTNITIHVDDYEVKEITGTVGESITTDLVYHDMTGITFNTSAGGTANGTVVVNSSTSGSVIVNDGDEHGDYIKTANRVTFTDAGVFEKGKKYYVSFDAKSGTGSEQTMWLSLAKLAHSSEVTKGSLANPRYNFSGDTSCPYELYIDGEKVDSMTEFAKLGADWKHYGIVIDFTDDNIVSYTEGKTTADSTDGKFFDAPRYFYVGVSGAASYLDNFRIVSTHDVEGAVPETDSKDITYVSKKYENDMSSGTLKLNGTNNATLSGGVVNVTSGRFTLTDSGIITPGHKYTISFDAKLSSGTEAYLTMIISHLSSAGDKPRYFIINGTNDSASSSSTDKTVRGKAFKFYILDENGNKVETTNNNLANYKVTDQWQTFVIEFDYTNEDFLKMTEGEFKNSNAGQLQTDVCYFHVGANNGMFDNLKIVEHTPGVMTEVSYREASGAGESYLSAGLRFKAGIATSVAENAAEIGFVVAPSTSAALTADWYNVENGVNQIARQGVVKNTALDKNYVYATDGDVTYYQMVITGLSTETGKTAYNRRYTVVLYVKDASGNYTYVPLGEASYYQALGNSSIFAAQ